MLTNERSTCRRHTIASSFLIVLVIVNRKLHEVGLDKLVDLAVHHAIHIGGLIVGAVVLDTAVVEHIAAYLATPLDLLLSCLNLGLCLQTFLHGSVVELTLEQEHGLGAVLGLVTRLGVLDKDLFFLARVGVGVPIAQTHARLYLVHVLSTGTARAEGVS